MSYNTIANFKLYAYPSGSFNDIPTTVIQNYLDVAASELNSALSRHHTLPLNTGSYDSSSRLACIYDAERVLAGYKCLLWQGFRPNVDNTQDVVIINMVNDIRGKDGLLDKLLAGKIIFPNDADATPETRETMSKVVGKPGRNARHFDDDGNEYIKF